MTEAMAVASPVDGNRSRKSRGSEKVWSMRPKTRNPKLMAETYRAMKETR